MIDYPIKFSPIFKQKIWGGAKIKTLLHKNIASNNIGESWEISDVENNTSVVAEGELKGQTLKQLLKKYKGSLVGKKNYDTFGNNFPILIKFIDAKAPLSIQVHPNDTLAKQRHNSLGKDEIWYVMQADENAELIVGLKKDVDKQKYLEHLKNTSIKKVLNTEKVFEGDVFHIPTGRVHAIGSGVLLAEIQQTSDITYRIYDYNRVDTKTKQKRELHTNLALEAIDFKHYSNYKIDYKKKVNIANKIICNNHFKINKIAVRGEITLNYTSLDSFVIYICVDGKVEILLNNNVYYLQKGETTLLSATTSLLKLKSKKASLLEVYL